jgi:hypothetical protein
MRRHVSQWKRKCITSFTRRRNFGYKSLRLWLRKQTDLAVPPIRDVTIPYFQSSYHPITHHRTPDRQIWTPLALIHPPIISFPK